MSVQSTALLTGLILSLIIILAVSVKSKHFFSCFFLTASSGIGALFFLKVFSVFLPITLPVNFFTLAVSALSGIPGVAALLVTALF